MEKLLIITNLTAPVNEVWGVLGAVGGVDQWSPIINSCTLSSSSEGGLQRTCTSDNGVLHERILLLDHQARRLSYAITEQEFFPIDDLITNIQVSEKLGKTIITTEVTYSLRDGAPSEEIKSGLKGVYDMSYEGIEKLVLQTA